MKNIVRFAAFIIVVFILAAPARAQFCSGALYQYADTWADETGNAIVDNYTEADPCGDSYTTIADVTINAASGTLYASSTGFSSFAEAMASVAMPEQGSFDGNSEVEYSCGATGSAFFSGLLWSCVGGTPVISACAYSCYTPSVSDGALGAWYLTSIKVRCSNVTTFCPYFLEAETAGASILGESAEIVKNSCQLYRH